MPELYATYGIARIAIRSFPMAEIITQTTKIVPPTVDGTSII